MTFKTITLIFLANISFQLFGASETSKVPYQKMIEISSAKKPSRQAQILEKLKKIDCMTQPPKRHWLLERAANAYADLVVWTFKTLDYSDDFYKDNKSFEDIVKDIHRELALQGKQGAGK